MDAKQAFERHVQGLVGLAVESVDYWDVYDFSDGPTRWDYGDWHHAAMGVELGTAGDPVTIIWTNRFFPYGVEVFREPIESFLVLHKEGPQRVGPNGPSAWDRFLGHRVIAVATYWDTLSLGASTRDGHVIEPASELELPTAIRLDFGSGSVWFVAAIPQAPDMTEVFMPGDEIMVLFSQAKAQAMGLHTRSD
ncbi:MAG: hypothetical protein KBG85_10960 [Micropruina sp.]|nr:hypothetical protein [Micropruina sp.]